MRLRNIFLFGTIILAIFSGCQKKEASSAEDAKPKNVSIRFSWWGNDLRHEATLKVLKMYTQIHPNVTIEGEYRGKSEREKIATELSGGTVADIVQLNPPWMGDFTSSGDFFVDLNSKKNLIDLAGFDRKFVTDYGIYNGKLIALPSGINSQIMIMNKTAAEKMGIPTSMDTKWTWDDLYNIGKTVNKKDSGKYMLNGDTHTTTELILKRYIIQKTGKQLIGDDYSLGFTKEDLFEGLSYMAKLYMDKVIIPASEGNVFKNAENSNPKWIQGNLVAGFSWTSLILGATAGMTDKTCVFPIPLRPDAKNTSLVVKPSQLIAVSQKSKYPDEAIKFLNYFFNDVEAGKILKDHRSIPPVKAVREACLSAGLIDQRVIIGNDYGQANMGLYENANSTNAEFIQILDDATEKVAYDSKQVKSVTEQTMKLIEDILATLKKKK